MRPLIIALFIFCGMGTAIADVASTTYVNNVASTCVSIKNSADQELKGKYSVSGTFDVPTPTLPSKVE